MPSIWLKKEKASNQASKHIANLQEICRNCQATEYQLHSVSSVLRSQLGTLPELLGV